MRIYYVHLVFCGICGISVFRCADGINLRRKCRGRELGGMQQSSESERRRAGGMVSKPDGQAGVCCRGSSSHLPLPLPLPLPAPRLPKLLQPQLQPAPNTPNTNANAHALPIVLVPAHWGLPEPLDIRERDVPLHLAAQHRRRARVECGGVGRGEEGVVCAWGGGEVGGVGVGGAWGGVVGRGAGACG